MLLRVRNDRLLIVLLVAVIAFAWMGLWVWGQSPYQRFLDHEALTDLTSEDAALLVFFVGGWTLMIFAMMLPTSLPLVAMFSAMTKDRQDHSWLMALLIVGYLGVWMGFGAVVHLADLGVHEATEQVAWLDANYWVIGAATLVLAGVYQFTPLKYHCLDKCRSPMSFIAGHWTGRNHVRQAFRLGLDHGIFCLGCCWPLMLIMFAVGAGSIGWMLVLGAVMVIEKNLPWGRRLSKPLGIALVAWGVTIAVGLGPWSL